MVGIDLFSFNSCALVVVGSLRRPGLEILDPRSLLRGVEGGSECVEPGVVGVGILVIEEVAEWPPSRDCDLRWRFGIGPPLSETGSKEEDVRSCPPNGRGSREIVVVVVETLLVNVSETAVFGRAGLV
jgi:hypothetical protein